MTGRALLRAAAGLAVAAMMATGCAATGAAAGAGPGAARGAGPRGSTVAGTGFATGTGAGTGSAAGTGAGTTATAASCDPYASSLAPGGPATVTPGSFAARIRARGHLIAGVDQSTYHFGFLNPLDNKIEGFDIDMIDAVAEAIFGSGYQSHIEFKAIADSQRIPDLVNGSVDIVAHTMTITCNRLRQIDFSSVYYNAQAKVLVLKDSKATDLAGLAGQKVCATQGSDDIAIIQHYHATPVAVPFWTDCLVDLQQGSVAGVVTDDSILHGLAAQDPWTKIVGGSLQPEPYGLGMSKQHPDFVRFVNAVLARIEADGTWQADYRQWVGGPAPGPPVPQYAG